MREGDIMLKYKMITYQIETDSGLMWVAEYPSLPGVVGSSFDLIEAIKDLEVNALAQIGFMRDEGKEVPSEDSVRVETEYSGKTVLRMPKSVHRKMSELAEIEGVSLNSLLNDAISQYIGKGSSNPIAIDEHVRFVSHYSNVVTYQPLKGVGLSKVSSSEENGVNKYTFGK